MALLIVFCALRCSAPAQTLVWGVQPDDSTIWSPQLLLRFDDNSISKSTVPKELMSSLVVDGVPIALEEHSELEALRVRFGGEIGRQGDASEALSWLCLHGNDTTGPWVLWLESGEIDGPYVGAFQWRRVRRGTQFDKRCAALPDGARVRLPTDVTLGTPEDKVVRKFGPPTWRKGGALLYEHEHNEQIRGEEFTSFSNVIVGLRNGVVWAIDVVKTTTN